MSPDKIGRLLAVVTSLEILANELDTAQRQGHTVDKPEGNRFITVSDTLARQISLSLKKSAQIIQEVIKDE